MTYSINKKVKLNEIPQELKALNQWVAWKAEPRKNNKMGKIPINPYTKKSAKTNDPSTWGSFEDAVACYQENNLAGISLIFTKDDPYIGIDVDDCFIDETLLPKIKDLIQKIGSYTEISPSGKGLHVIIKGQLPAGGKNGKVLEIYDTGRAFTFTGDKLPSAPAKISDGSSIIDYLLTTYFPKTPPVNNANSIHEAAPNKVHMDKFDALWSGHYQGFGYNSQSEADLALCQLLLQQSGGNLQVVDQLFRKSALYRDKWDEVHSGDGMTYGEKTLQTAQASCRPQTQPKQQQITFPCTDLGNAERLAHHHGENLKYCKPWNKWVFWDGVKWSEDETGKINQYAKKTVRKIYDEAKHTEDDNKRQAIGKHANASESNSRINAMISLAQGELAVSPNDFDQHRFLLNCENGTVDLKTGDFGPHQKENYITKLAHVRYDESATCPLWESFLNRIMDNNQDLMQFLQRAIGYALTGDVSEQCLFLLWGSGANGKSTFLRTIGNILGDYSQHTPTDTLIVKKRGAITNDLARMQGARFVTATESEAHHQLAENLIKQMTGDDIISARFLYKETFEFEPEHKIFLGTNNKPIIRGNDYAIWRRMRLIPFTVTIPPEEMDKNLINKLKAEYSGILNWAIKGCLEWQNHGLGTPAEVTEATDEYRNEMDLLNDFIQDCCIEGPDLFVPAKDLNEAYAKWCEVNGEFHLNAASFGRKLTEKGFVRAQRGKRRTRGWIGLNLIDGRELG
jgi:putative DNA primase/helicase